MAPTADFYVGQPSVAARLAVGFTSRSLPAYKPSAPQGILTGLLRRPARCRDRPNEGRASQSPGRQAPSFACRGACAASGDPGPDAARDRDHGRLRSSRNRCSTSASTSRSTLTQQPPSSISSFIRGAEHEDDSRRRCLGAETIAGLSPLSRSSRANWRHVNIGSQTTVAGPPTPIVARRSSGHLIRCFSSNVQMAPSPSHRARRSSSE
ncbi:hypothetical protein ACVINW_003800 [Bradyrhizobium sp. USDA 4461]